MQPWFSAVDDGVGAVVAKLKEEHLDESTLVMIFLSDNGGPDYFPGGPSNAQYSGWKRYHLEGGHRVPFFVSWPTKISGGRVLSQLTSSLDLFPTIAAAAGVQIRRTGNWTGSICCLASWPEFDATAPRIVLAAGANYAVRAMASGS